MSFKNLCILVGNLGQDPEVSYTPNGTAVAKFSMATSEKFKDKQTGEVRDETQWHSVVCFGKTAEFVGKWVSKGMKVMVEGKIKYSTYQKRDGTKGFGVEITSNSVNLLEKPQQRDSVVESNRKEAMAMAEESFDDDIPF